MMRALNGQAAGAITTTADRPVQRRKAAAYLKGKGSLLERPYPPRGY